MEFSVLMAVYRKENPAWFREALESIFRQTVQPDEIVLVKDGGLTEELDAVIDEYKARHPLFRIVENPTNMGLGLSLRKGVEACSFDLIARMDSDDLLPADRFEKQLARMREGYDVVSCWSIIFKGSLDHVVALKTRPEHHGQIVKLAHSRSPVCHAACFLRRQKVLEAGNYVHCPYYEDYHLWVRMILAGARFYNCQEPLYYIRTSDEQLNRRSGFAYLKNELRTFVAFRQMGFYSAADVVRNSAIRIGARLAPKWLRTFLFKKIWNHKN